MPVFSEAWAVIFPALFVSLYMPNLAWICTELSPFPALTDAPEIAVLWPVRLEPELVLIWSPHMKMVSLPDPVITCDVLAMAVPLSTETTTLLSPLPALMTLPAPRAVWVP